jgi:aminoglycoside phosphotransferase (APT) family kinase protein
MADGARPDLPPAVVAALGGHVAVVGDLARPWAGATHTLLVEADPTHPGAIAPATDAGVLGVESRLVVQWSADRAAIARRMRVGRWLAAAAPAIPIPSIVAGDALAPVPYLVTRHVPGLDGRELLRDDAGAAALGTAAGRLALELRAVPTAGLRLPRRWADADALGVAALRWLDRAVDVLEPGPAGRIRAFAGRLAEEIGTPAPVFAHGDLAPVNLLLDAGRVVGLLDLERARLAHPLYDAAWWTWIVGHHHPDRAATASASFLAAAGIDADRATDRILGIIGALACLEALAALPRRAVDQRLEWARRVAGCLDRTR